MQMIQIKSWQQQQHLFNHIGAFPSLLYIARFGFFFFIKAWLSIHDKFPLKMYVRIILTNLVFKVIIQKNCYSQITL